MIKQFVATRKNRSYSHTHTNSIIFTFYNLAASRWLSIRLEMLGNIIVLFAALFVVLGRDTIDPGIVGLSLNYASQITMTLNMLIRQTSQVETSMVSKFSSFFIFLHLSLNFLGHF